MPTPAPQHFLDWKGCAAVLRWSDCELPVVANLVCDHQFQIDIVLPAVPITAPLFAFIEFADTQPSSGGYSIKIESTSGDVAQSDRLSLVRWNTGTESAELRLLCQELLVITYPAGEPSDLYRYVVRGLLCSGRFPVTAEFDFGSVTILGPMIENQPNHHSVGGIWVRPNGALTADEVDAGVNRVLDILSFATGRSLRCSIRTRQVGTNTEHRIWPRDKLAPRKWPPFHHLDLTPIVSTAARTYTASCGIKTGIGLAIQWSTAHSPFGSVRFVQLMIALEHLIHCAESRVTLLPRPVFTELLRRMQDVISEFSNTEGGRYREECSALAQSVSHLNQRAFKKQIRCLLAAYRVPTEGVDDHIDDLVGLRNALVHRGIEEPVHGKPVVEHELVLREIVTRIVLAVLEFDGVYNSWVSGSSRDVRFSRTCEKG